jgi:hypothetical protein
LPPLGRMPSGHGRSFRRAERVPGVRRPSSHRVSSDCGAVLRLRLGRVVPGTGVPACDSFGGTTWPQSPARACASRQRHPGPRAHGTPSGGRAPCTCPSLRGRGTMRRRRNVASRPPHRSVGAHPWHRGRERSGRAVTPTKRAVRSRRGRRRLRAGDRPATGAVARREVSPVERTTPQPRREPAAGAR